MKLKIVFLTLILVLLVTTGFSCRLTSPKTKEQLKPVTLTWWRVWDNVDNFTQIISNYKAIHPHVSIAYKKFRYEEYEQALLEAWAEDNGPDIFSVPVVWLKKYQNKISPLPESTQVAKQVITGPSWKQDTKIISETTLSPSPQTIKTNWAPTVYNDIIIDDKVFGLPLSLDTLVLFYNSGLLDRAKIIYPPKTWADFKEQVIKLSLVDEENSILQAGAAIGTASNVPRNADILSLLMLQNGVAMPNFNSPHPQDSNYFPGQEALRFYTDFANPAKEVYTWNDKMPDALDAFIQGKAAFFFGYSFHLPIIQARAPKLNFEIGPAPQIALGANEINSANYWVETAALKGTHQNEAWNFIQFATSEKQVLSYLKSAKKPTALRSLIQDQEKDYDLQIFANQVLNAQNWYHGQDFNQVEAIFKEMVESVNQGTATIPEATNYAAGRVKATY